jgi:NitT/TauT family transport system substrate-binding protein
MVTFPGYAPLYLAREKNLFENVDVDLVRIEAIGDLRAALMSGKIDIYAATFDIFQTTEKLEPPGVGFLAIDESDGADGLVVSDKIKNIGDLKGKKVAAEPGLPPYFVLQYMLNKANLTLKDVDFKDVASQDAGNAFVAGNLDAAGTYEPYLSKSKDLRKGSKILVSSKDIPGLIVDLLFASDQLLKNKPQVLKAVADGWFRGVEYWQSHPDEAMDVMSKSFGVSKQELLDMKTRLKWMTKDDNIQMFDPKAANNVYDTFNLVGEILVKNNSNGLRVWAKDKLSPVIIQMYK